MMWEPWGSIFLESGIGIGGTFPLDTTIEEWVALDTFGVGDTCTFLVIVNDSIDPQITCPADTIVNTSTTSCSRVVNYATPVGTDNCSATTVLTAGLTSGSDFPQGPNFVSYQVTDYCRKYGNLFLQRNRK